MQQTTTTFVLDSSNLTAEIIWAIKCVMNGYSNNSCSDMIVTFRAMFLDSYIAKNYQISSNKLQYVVNWELDPYFKEILVEDVNKSKFLSIKFVGKPNHSLLSNRFSIIVRYWDSAFLCHTTANDLLRHFINTIDSVNQSNIHGSMNRPCVNCKFYKDLEEHCKREELPDIISFGSCNLHILHGAFESGFEVTDWEIKKLLKESHPILYGNPPRRVDFFILKSLQNLLLPSVAVAG